MRGKMELEKLLQSGESAAEILPVIAARFAERLEACRVITEASGVRTASDHFPLLANLTV